MTSALTPTEADALLSAMITDPEARQDPPATFRRLHAELPAWDSALGMTVLAGYHDGLETLRSPKWGRAEDDMDLPESFGTAERGDRERIPSMLLMNPPDHTRVRSLVARAFTPRMVERLRPQIEAILDPLLDCLATERECDLMTTLAVPFPVAVISALLGVPPEKGADPSFVQQIRHLTSFIDSGASAEDIAAAQLAAVEVAGYFTELVEVKRADPDDAMLSALIEVEEAGDRLSHEELIINSILMYAAGFETTSNLIGNGMWALLRNPDQLELLRSDRSLMPAAIWEMLRFDSPVQINMRFSLEPVEFLGRTVERGHSAMVLQGAGNHDPAVYDDPDRFDVGRFAAEGVPQPLSFGWGAHHCLGAHLARAEGEILFTRLLDRFGSIELVGEPPRYRAHATLRGLESLHVRLAE
ncbi:MAG: cytochrome P450 [Microthrixaceae bacterium]|nr:cytochrome P450 [Microthrixaceae bacterium]MCO5311543.1 cytochrome P450 [Microthrixaceae bacterium]